jgi:putative endonuclease
VTDDRRHLGAGGEDLAARWYEARGGVVVDRNWRCPQGELDLVVRLGSTMVFCEVKARTTAAFGSPFEAVTVTKQRRIRRLAAAWLDQSGERAAALRFDVAGLLGGRLEVVEGAF